MSHKDAMETLPEPVNQKAHTGFNQFLDKLYTFILIAIIPDKKKKKKKKTKKKKKKRNAYSTVCKTMTNKTWSIKYHFLAKLLEIFVSYRQISSPSKMHAKFVLLSNRMYFCEP